MCQLIFFDPMADAARQRLLAHFDQNKNSDMEENCSLNNNEEKIMCPKCLGKIGGYKWSGYKCTCGKWESPGFYVHKSRVDIKKPIVFASHVANKC